MARRQNVSSPPKAPMALRESRAAIRDRLEERVKQGRTIRAMPVNSTADFTRFEAEFDKWNDYNRDLLRTLFTNEDFAEEYSWNGLIIAYSDLSERYQGRVEQIEDKCIKLESIVERLELYPEPASAPPQPSARQGEVSSGASNDIFIVHGHDGEAKEAVARFISKLGLNPIILHEQANAGQTIIEKLETNSKVGFAVVLLTPDDEGRARGTSTFQERARQNVILELGYFVAKLGRGKVCALHKGNLELPSDILGVLYVPYDLAGAWRLQLAKELKAAKFQVNADALL